MAKDQRDITGSLTPSGVPAYAVTNRVVDRDFNCNAADTLVTSDVLGTLIEDLIAQGILKGTVVSGS